MMLLKSVIKADQHGSAERYKSRCAIRGDRLRPNIDFDADNTVAHMPSQTAKRLLLAESARFNLPLQSWGVPGAYARAPADPQFRLTMKQPPLSDGTLIAPGKICVMQRAINGSPDTNRFWAEHRDREIVEWGWTQPSSCMMNVEDSEASCAKARPPASLPTPPTYSHNPTVLITWTTCAAPSKQNVVYTYLDTFFGLDKVSYFIKPKESR